MGCLPYFDTWCGPSANLECRPEMCCTQLAGNAWPKNRQKIRNLGTIAQFCRAISSQLRHISTIGKKLVKQRYLPICSHNMLNFGPLAAEICWHVWGTSANFNRVRLLAPSLLGTRVVGISQSLRRWTEGAAYIRKGGHHVGHWPTFWCIILISKHSCGEPEAVASSYRPANNVRKELYCKVIMWGGHRGIGLRS